MTSFEYILRDLFRQWYHKHFGRSVTAHATGNVSTKKFLVAGEPKIMCQNPISN